MELRDLIGVLIRHLGLLIAGTVLAMAGSYFALQFLAPWPRYQATATVLIGSNDDSDWAALQMGGGLAPTYVEWAKRRPVLQSAINALGLPLSFEKLREQIDVHAIKDTQFIEISATSTSPEEAAVIANEVAWQLTQHPLPGVRGADYMDSFIIVAEQAVPPSQPLQPRINVFVAGITGLVLATGLAFVLEHLDDTVKTTTDVVEHLSVPVLGVITPWTRPGRGPLRRSAWRHFAKNPGASKLCAADLTHLTVTYRRLSANIARTKKGPLQGIIFVTSPTSEKGKVMTALGLAMAWAETGRRTILIDASLHDPVLHTWLDLPNEVGLVGLLEASENNQGPDLSRLLHPIGRGDLRVMTSGPVDTVSPELLLSPRLQARLDVLSDQADVVLLSGPPVLSGLEAAILASKVNYIVLVLDARKTQVEEAQEAVEVLTATNSTTVGVVLNSP